MTDCRRICMWSGPRNVSTAMMYSWSQRSDTAVWDEPMYGHYLAVTGVDHPGREAILAAVPHKREEVLDAMLRRPCPRPIWFFKNMAHHLVGFDIAMIDELDNFLLTRDPREMLPSLARGLGRAPTMADTGYDRQVAIVERLVASGRDPIVVDSRELLTDPRSVLGGLCRGLGLSFEEEMLSWPPGPKPEDGVWAPDWYARLHETTGFVAYRPTTEAFPERLEPIYAECLPHYRRLASYAIRA